MHLLSDKRITHIHVHIFLVFSMCSEVHANSLQRTLERNLWDPSQRFISDFSAGYIEPLRWTDKHDSYEMNPLLTIYWAQLLHTPSHATPTLRRQSTHLNNLKCECFHANYAPKVEWKRTAYLHTSVLFTSTGIEEITSAWYHFANGSLNTYGNS